MKSAFMFGTFTGLLKNTFMKSISNALISSQHAHKSQATTSLVEKASFAQSALNDQIIM